MHIVVTLFPYSQMFVSMLYTHRKRALRDFV